MYIAGRLRTASSPPRTLIEVASYLCPAAGISFSAMKYVSPQVLRAAVVPGGAWEGGRADEPETCLAHWSPPREIFRLSRDSKGVFRASSRPIPKFSGGRGETPFPN